MLTVIHRNKRHLVSKRFEGCCRNCVLHCTALRCAALRCAALRCAALHCAALRCTALPCAALRCTQSRVPSVYLLKLRLQVKTLSQVTDWSILTDVFVVYVSISAVTS
jgi:hypothetical protein